MFRLAVLSVTSGLSFSFFRVCCVLLIVWMFYFCVVAVPGKGKVKLSLCLTTLHHEGVWGNGCEDLHFLDLSTSWR
jgi:hypothetical protein